MLIQYFLVEVRLIFSKKMFELLFDAMHRYFNVASSAEISMEMNPGFIHYQS